MSKLFNLKTDANIADNFAVVAQNEKMIHKANEVIHNMPNLSLESMRLLNELYYQVQIRKDKKNQDSLKYDSLDFYRLQFTQTQLKKWMGIEKYNNYSKMIKKSLTELKETIELKNVRVNEEREKEYVVVSFINEYSKEYEDINNKHQKMYEIEINHTMHQIIINSNIGYFTKLNLEYQSKFKTKNAIRLYEYCKSFQKQSYTPPMSLDLLNKLFISNYKYMSEALKVLHRNLKIVNTISDIEISILENKESKRRTPKGKKVKISYIQLSIKKTTKQQLKETNQMLKTEGYKKHFKDKNLINEIHTDEQIINNLLQMEA